MLANQAAQSGWPHVHYLATLPDGSERKRPWAVLVDGSEKQPDLVLGFVRQYRPDVSLILDFIHVLEYLWKAAYGFHAVGSVEPENRMAARAFSLLKGDCAGVAWGLRESAALNHVDFDKRKAIEKCADYLEKYAPMDSTIQLVASQQFPEVHRNRLMRSQRIRDAMTASAKGRPDASRRYVSSRNSCCRCLTGEYYAPSFQKSRTLSLSCM